MASSNQNLKMLLAQGKLENALETLVRLTEYTDDAELRQRALTLSGQFAALKKQHLAGLLDDKDYRLQWNRIAEAVADIADSEAFDSEAVTDSHRLATSTRWKKWVVILAVLASSAGITGYILRDIFWPKKEPEPIARPAVEPAKKDTFVIVVPPPSKSAEKPVNRPASAKKDVEVKVEGDVKGSNIIIGNDNQVKQNQ